MAIAYYHFEQLAAGASAWPDGRTSTAIPARGGRIQVPKNADIACVLVPNRYVSVVHTGLDDTGAASADDVMYCAGNGANPETLLPAVALAHSAGAIDIRTLRLPVGGENVFPPNVSNADAHVLNLGLLSGAAQKVQVELIVNQTHQ